MAESLRHHTAFLGRRLDLAIARGNDAADAQAKACVKQYQVSSALHRELVQAKLSQLKARSLLDSFHIHLALAAIGQDNGEFCAPSIPEELCLVGPSWKAPDVDGKWVRVGVDEDAIYVASGGANAVERLWPLEPSSLVPTGNLPYCTNRAQHDYVFNEDYIYNMSGCEYMPLGGQVFSEA
eukprot:symbB.v1.2.027113.t1/scaffold2756.1/size127779/6